MRNLFICLLLYPLLAIAQSERITDIYGVRFGESYENAREALQKRLGTPYDVSVEDDFFSVCFENAEYEGITFHNLYFFGNISGSSSFFNGAFMQIFCASKEDAEKTCRQMKTTLAKKYTIDEFTNDDGSLIFKGGEHPFDADKYGFYIETVYIEGSPRPWTAQLSFGNYHFERRQPSTGLFNTYKQLFENGKYAEALTELRQVEKSVKESYGQRHELYAFTLNLMAECENLLGHYEEAVSMERMALDIRKEVLGENAPEYLLSLNNLATYISETGKTDEAISMYNSLLEKVKKVHGEKSEQYAKVLENLSVCYSDIENMNEAIRYSTIALGIRKQINGEKSEDYAQGLNILASLVAAQGNYQQALTLEEECLGVIESLVGDHRKLHAKCLSKAAEYHSALGHNVEAIRLERKSLDIKKQTSGVHHHDYITSLNNIAVYHSRIGDYAEACHYLEEAEKTLEQLYGKNHPDVIKTKQNMATMQQYLGNYYAALTEAVLAAEQIKKQYGENSMEMANSNYLLASILMDMGEYEKALGNAKAALDIKKKTLGTDNLDYANSLNQLANIHYNLRNNLEAVRMATASMEIVKRTLGTDNPSYALALNNLSFQYFSIHDHFSVTRYQKEYIDLVRKIVLENFASMSSVQRSGYWKEYASSFDERLPLFCYYIKSQTLIETTYDAALFSKGLLLQTDMEMQKLIMESGNTALVDMYRDIQKKRTTLNQQYERPLAERTIDCDSLRRAITRQESELMVKSKPYGDYTANLRTDWHAVQQHLSADDIAIEFLRIPILNDSVMYVALTLKKDYKAPKLIPLFEEHLLTNSPIRGLEGSSLISQLVWKPLEGELSSAKNIFFAPAGELHRTGIEYADGMERYNFYRLTSTRMIASAGQSVKNGRGLMAALFGGLQYQFGKGDWEDEARRVAQSPSIEPSRSLDATITTWRDRISFLPGSEKEIIDIDNILRKKGNKTLLYTDMDGTESTLKRLSGKDIGLLHVSTHGFYSPKKEVRPTVETIVIVPSIGDMVDKPNAEDLALSRSGLFMAGAADALDEKTRGNIPEGVDDGVLTAREIAQLDLRTLDLVVLSACETGLGDVSGDGVFGLQRGFKKAGAKTLLMSLWKVDDRATQLLMTEFYRNLTAGHSKRQAFIAAQQHLRQCEGGKYNDPKYWAAFILLDAME